jgi:hypothetical protein
LKGKSKLRPMRLSPRFCDTRVFFNFNNLLTSN